MEHARPFARRAPGFNHVEFASRFHVEHQDARGQTGVNFILVLPTPEKTMVSGEAPARSARANSPPKPRQSRALLPQQTQNAQVGIGLDRVANQAGNPRQSSAQTFIITENRALAVNVRRSAKTSASDARDKSSQKNSPCGNERILIQRGHIVCFALKR